MMSVTNEQARPTNRLADETSPYLLQHAHNPVDWYPWGEAALARAKAEGRPIFLSIGYAACHWCHVMERESFEDETTAQLLNHEFVAIKVDREERPELDAIYMDAVQQMTGSGGWPLTVFLTPDGLPFYGGTYFPSEPRHGLPSFRQVLAGVADAWRQRRGEVEAAGAQIAAAIARRVESSGADGGRPAPGLLEAAVSALEADFDAHHGGWGGAPKFPQPMTIEFLLREHVRTGDVRPLAMARRTLDAMAAGGIFDQLGGGFARYSTDARWLVPHFEKMLYDNAQLARVYVHAWQLTDAPTYRAVAQATVEFMRRDMSAPEGGFISSLDADTGGVEGASYTWTRAQIEAVLGADAADFARAYGVTDSGNWEGTNVLARAAGVDDEQFASARARLLAARNQRPQPARDDKLLAAWNGLAIAALAEAARAFERADWAADAARAADLMLSRLRDADGRLMRSWRDGRASGRAVLEDHSHLAAGLLALYETDFNERWFVAARDLVETVLAHFADPAGGFFDTADDHEALIARPKGVQDNALPSGNAMAASVLQRLAALTGEPRYGTAAERALALAVPIAARYPTGFAQWLIAIEGALTPPLELAIVGDPAAPETRALLAVARRGYRPDLVVAVSARADDSAIPLMAGRAAHDGRATAYVCRNFACRQPVTLPQELAAQLAAG
jgi:uncharacterized protein YyaL (SSP411 family)